MNEFNWRRVNNVFEIFKILLSFKDDFYLKKMNDEKILLEFATKLSKYAFFIVIENNTESQGFIAFYANNFDTSQAFISSLVVKREYQHIGIGSKLLNVAENISKEQKMKTIALEVDKNNQKAIDFYKKNKFTFSSDLKKMLKELI